MSASGATITQVSVSKMRVAIVVQTTAALLLLLLSPAQVGTRKFALRESRGQICPFLKCKILTDWAPALKNP